jgi:small-conductance mechanosensitive channel
MKISNRTSLRLISVISLLLTAQVFAESKNQHFASLASPDIQTAKCNIQTYNEKLDALTQKSDITTLDMVKIHELTYTLEDALKRLSKDLATAAAELEKAHLASESMNKEVVSKAASEYSKLTRALIAPTSC